MGREGTEGPETHGNAFLPALALPPSPSSPLPSSSGRTPVAVSDLHHGRHLLALIDRPGGRSPSPSLSSHRLSVLLLLARAGSHFCPGNEISLD